MPRAEFLSFSPPCLSEAEIEAVVEVLRGPWLSSGPKTKQFEENFKATVGAEAALALNSCTAGLHLGMLLSGVGPEEEVITTPMTFCASTNVVEHVGGKLVLADIDPETLLIDVKEIEKKLTRKTKVICPVHYAGHPCDMPAIERLAQSHGGVKIVEDAAHCMPSKIGDKWVGSGSHPVVFSFYPTKNMTTGEGGMMTGPQDLIDRARSLALHGMSRNAWDRFNKGGSYKYEVPQPGFKYNMSDIAAAIGVVQLARLKDLFARRMKIVDIYESAFHNHPHLVPLKAKAGFQSSRHLYVIQLSLETLKIDRDKFLEHLNERNIGASVNFIPVHLFSYYRKKYGWSPEDFPNAYLAFQRIVSLPLSSRMKAEDAADVVEAVEDICTKYAR